MPYRRLPTTDKARIRALEAALEKSAATNGNPVALSDSYIDELKVVITRFKNTLTQYELDTKIQADKNHEYKAALKNARMYISHFIQVLFLTSERGEINGGIKYYGLKDFNGKIPHLNSEQEIIQWGAKIVEGEQKRIQNGGSAIYNPSIALVKIKVEAFRDAAIFQSNLKRNTARSFDKMKSVRKLTNDFISTMWTEIEENINVEDDDTKRKLAKEYGVVYVLRRNEKKKLKEKPVQCDLLFEF